MAPLYHHNCFQVKGVPFEAILSNDFLEPHQQTTDTGLDPAQELLAPPLRLDLELECPDCGLEFIINYYQAEGGQDASSPAARQRPDELGGSDLIPCPGCGQMSRLPRSEVRYIFEEQLRRALTGLDEDEPFSLKRLGRIIALAAILLEPLCLIFVVGLWSDRIGHLFRNTANLWLRARRFCPNGPPPLLIAFPPDPARCANSFALELWRRSGRYLFTPAAQPAYDLLRQLRGQTADNHRINLPTMFWGIKQNLLPPPDDPAFGSAIVVNCHPKPRQARHLIDLREFYWANNPLEDHPDPGPFFTFTEEERQKGRDWLAGRKLPDDCVSFLGRDRAYVEKVAAVANPNYNRTSDDYRNMDIKTMLPAMNWMAEQGVGVLRMGSAASEKLHQLRPGLVDYPFDRDRSELLDIYLSAHCRFTLTAASGLNEVQYFFGRPIILVNLPLDALAFATLPIYPQLYVAYKKVRCLKKNRCLSLREMYTRGVHTFSTTRHFQDAELELVESSEEELLAIAQEMHARFIARCWPVTDEEQRLRRRFVKVTSEFYPGLKIKGHPVFSFFRDNPYLLEDA